MILTIDFSLLEEYGFECDVSKDLSKVTIEGVATCGSDVFFDGIANEITDHTILRRADIDDILMTLSNGINDAILRKLIFRTE